MKKRFALALSLCLACSAFAQVKTFSSGDTFATADPFTNVEPAASTNAWQYLTTSTNDQKAWSGYEMDWFTWYPTNDATLSRMSVNVAQFGGTESMSMGVYSSSGALLTGVTNLVTFTGFTNWNWVFDVPDIAVTNGGKYYIALRSDNYPNPTINGTNDGEFFGYSFADYGGIQLTNPLPAATVTNTFTPYVGIETDNSAGFGPAAGGGGGSFFPFVEDFEATGFDRSEWATSGTFDADSVGFIHGAQGWHANSGASAVCTVDVGEDCDTIHVSLAFWRGASSTQSDIIKMLDASDNVLARILVGNGSSTALHGSVSSATGNSSETWYYAWIDYTKGTGGDGVMDYYQSTTITKPGSPTLSITTGDSTAAARKIQLLGPGTDGEFYVDYIRISKSAIGNFP